MIGVAIFTLASVAAGLAQSADQLNLARFVQGVGSGFINPQGVGMIQQYFRGAERGRAFGFFGTAVGVSVAIGPVLGGFLIELGGENFGWRLTFLVNVPVGLLTLWLGYRWFPRPLLHRPRLANGDPAVGHSLLQAETQEANSRANLFASTVRENTVGPDLSGHSSSGTQTQAQAQAPGPKNRDSARWTRLEPCCWGWVCWQCCFPLSKHGKPICCGCWYRWGWCCSICGYTGSGCMRAWGSARWST